MQTLEEKLEGIYGKCEACHAPIYDYMEDNKKIFDDTEMCGACATGEAATYTDEL